MFACVESKLETETKENTCGATELFFRIGANGTSTYSTKEFLSERDMRAWWLGLDFYFPHAELGGRNVILRAK